MGPVRGASSRCFVYLVRQYNPTLIVWAPLVSQSRGLLYYPEYMLTTAVAHVRARRPHCGAGYVVVSRLTANSIILSSGRIQSGRMPHIHLNPLKAPLTPATPMLIFISPWVLTMFRSTEKETACRLASEKPSSYPCPNHGESGPAYRIPPVSRRRPLPASKSRHLELCSPFQITHAGIERNNGNLELTASWRGSVSDSASVPHPSAFSMTVWVNA